MDSADEITIELVSAVTDDVRALIGELDRILAAEYTPDQRHGLSSDAIFEPGVRFFVARSNGAAVGCGGVALFAGFAEVKRMYVREAARGRGVAQALLARIEREALDTGLVSILRGIRRLRQDGRAGDRHQRVPRKAAKRVDLAMPDRWAATSRLSEAV